jgi:hypothetical protein
MGEMATTALTRRRDPEVHQETWHVYYRDVHVGIIGVRAGVPVDVDQWGWTARCCRWSTAPVDHLHPKPLGDRGRQDALAVAGGGEIITRARSSSGKVDPGRRSMVTSTSPGTEVIRPCLNRTFRSGFGRGVLCDVPIDGVLPGRSGTALPYENRSV